MLCVWECAVETLALATSLDDVKLHVRGQAVRTAVDSMRSVRGSRRDIPAVGEREWLAQMRRRN